MQKAGYITTAAVLLLLSTTALAAPTPLASASNGDSKEASTKDGTKPGAKDNGGTGIAAIVGDDIISSYDVDSRIKFIMATTQLSDTPDMLARIRPQVVRSLIDEKLEMREAKKNEVKVTDQQITDAVSTIEHERGMPAGAIFQQLEEKHVPKETFLNQVRAQLAWGDVLRKTIRPHVHISDAEIDLARKRVVTAPTVYKEVEIGVITLPVDKLAREGEIHKLGDKLVKEVRTGANFEAVGSQLGSTAGGKVVRFWVRPEQLDPAVSKALSTTKPGDITDPVRTEMGYTIVKIYDAHAVEETAAKDQQVNLKEILLKLKPDASNKEADVLLQIGEDVAKHPGTCTEKGVANISNLQDFDISVDYKEARLSELPPAVKIIAENLKVGDISTPFASSEGIRLYMLCDKKEAGPALLDRDKVADAVYHQRMELEAQKYMRQLRRDTYIEVR